MQPLNLPSYNTKLQKRGGTTKIFDILRKKFVALTPEEWVRQHFIHFLIEHKNYSPNLMNNEVKLELNGMSKRCDTLVFNRQGKPIVIVEYKASHIEINQKVFDQITRYNMVLGVQYLVLSNGLVHYCVKVDLENNSYSFLENIPEYDDIANG